MGNRVRIASRYNAPSSTHLSRNYSARRVHQCQYLPFPTTRETSMSTKDPPAPNPRPPSSSGAERVSGQTIQVGFVPLNPCAPIIVAHGSGSGCSPSTPLLSRLRGHYTNYLDYFGTIASRPDRVIGRCVTSSCKRCKDRFRQSECVASPRHKFVATAE